jgi:metallophosphoesterase (TIGR00282 family)
MRRILFIGDIVGRPGRQLVIDRLSGIRKELRLDGVVANGENAAGGSGINSSIVRDLLSAGVDAITLGDHVWDQRGFEREIAGIDHICRPANLPEVCPGKSFLVVDFNGFKLAIFTVLGRQYLALKSECPFLKAKELVDYLKGKADAVLVEIHAEATSEKVALGWYLDGQVAAVLGTHTHIPTADFRVLPMGTAYMTDVGMTGPFTSVLGRSVEVVIERFLDGMPRKFPVATDDVRLCGCILTLNSKGLADQIERVEITAEGLRIWD